MVEVSLDLLERRSVTLQESIWRGVPSLVKVAKRAARNASLAVHAERLLAHLVLLSLDSLDALAPAGLDVP
jgi:hypothetical protein